MGCIFYTNYFKDKLNIHWELEYPEVFFGQDGEKITEAGFDAVVGNPPYVVVEGHIEQYLRDRYQSPHYFVDLFHVFIEQGIGLMRNSGEFGYIVPEPWLTMENTESLRSVVLEESRIRRVTRFENQVFNDATVDTVTIHLENSPPDKVEVAKAENTGSEIASLELVDSIPQSQFEDTDHKEIEVRQTAEERDILKSVKEDTVTIENIAEVSIGIQAYNSSKHSQETIESRAFHADHKKSDEYLPEVSGQDVSRYKIQHDGETWVKYGPHLHDYRPMRFFSEPRVLVREITDSGRYRIHAAFTDKEMCNYKTVLNVLPKEGYSPHYILGVLNSALMSWIFPRTSNKVVSDTFPRISVSDIETLPIPAIKTESGKAVFDIVQPADRSKDVSQYDIPENTEQQAAVVTVLAEKQTELRENIEDLNLSVLDHFGAYDNGRPLSDIGLTQPPKGSADSILHETSEQKPNLRIGEVAVKRESENTIEIQLSARYKPDDDEDAYETDQWGYTETKLLPALRITDLSVTEANLIEHFVPVAVDEANGFANFRETATKTNSLVDRLEKLTLPVLDDVQEDLTQYIETRERADELEERINRTDELIDEVVYRLYGLTEEEVKTIEGSLEG